MATNIKRKHYVSPTPQPDEMDLDAFEALADWVEIRHVTEVGESGVSTNILTLPTMDTEFNSKGKGISDAGDMALTVKYVPTDEGQTLMAELAQTNMYYAFKTEWNDKRTASGTGTIKYDRGLVAGPTVSGGGPEEFHTRTFTCAFEQRPFDVPAT